jgi:hypothetical protein
MKITRLTELSLYYKLRETLSIKRTADLAKSVDFLTYTLKYNNITTTFDVVVSVNGTIATSGYVVDYINGAIKFNNALTASDQVKVDYYYCPFNLYDESSNETTDNNFKYPAIAIYEDDTDTQPYELGSASTEKIKTYVIQVWSERGGERNDATDSIVEMLEGSIPIVDYNAGFPTNADGTKNDSFNPYNYLTVAVSDSINYRKGGSLDIGKKAKYFAEIYVDFKIFI